MDAMTYVVLGGWILMYFVPSFMLALLIAAVMAFGTGYIVFTRTAEVGADLFQTMITVSPIAFVAIFAAWPLGVAMRWIARRIKRAGA